MTVTMWIGDVAIAGDSWDLGITRQGFPGWYDLPAVKSSFEARQAGHGSYRVAEPLYSGRTVVVNVGTDLRIREDLIALWQRINALHRTEQIVRVRDEGADTFIRAVVETEYPSGWVWDSQRFTITLTAADPIRYAWEEQRVMLTAGARVGALDYVIEYPIDYGDDVASASPSGSVSNTGNVATGPVITVEGSYPRGFTLLGAGGRAIIYPQPVFLGTPVVIDCVRRMAICNGVNVSRNLTRREWFSLPPGGSTTVTLVAGEDVAAGKAWATLSARSAWI